MDANPLLTLCSALLLMLSDAAAQTDIAAPDDSRAKKNVLVLAIASAILGAQMPVHFTLAARVAVLSAYLFEDVVAAIDLTLRAAYGFDARALAQSVAHRAVGLPPERLGLCADPRNRLTCPRFGTDVIGHASRHPLQGGEA